MIGYAIETETEPGVWCTTIEEHRYFGDLIRQNHRTTGDNKINPEFTISNQISFIADQFAYMNFHKIRFIEIMGVRWQPATIDIERPRLIITVGGVYNEND